MIMAKSSLKLEVVKYNALKLRKNYQLPYQLVYYINQLDKESDINWVKYLVSMSEHLLRVKGYYKKYPIAEEDANEQLRNDFNKFFSNRA